MFGGLQIIVVGDFLQLRPVKNLLYEDPGWPCYKSPAWKAAVSHVIVLKEVLRQDEPALVKVMANMFTTTTVVPASLLILHVLPENIY